MKQKHLNQIFAKAIDGGSSDNYATIINILRGEVDNNRIDIDDTITIRQLWSALIKGSNEWQKEIEKFLSE